MRKTVFRYFFDFLDGQEKWLNQMAAQGYRLIKCGKAWYTFETCQPGEYQYAVDFVADKGYKDSRDYRAFLESMGYRTFYKNINLNFSIGKVKWRPWAKASGQITTSPGTFNKELLIIEKKNDGTPFELHTDLQDRLSVYRTIRNALLWSMPMMLILLGISFVPGLAANDAATCDSVTWLLVALRIMLTGLVVFYGIMTVRIARIARRLKEESRTHE